MASVLRTFAGRHRSGRSGACHLLPVVLDDVEQLVVRTCRGALWGALWAQPADSRRDGDAPDHPATSSRVSCRASHRQAQRRLRDYVAEVARADVQRVGGVRRDPEVVTRLLRSLARNVGTPASINLLRADVNGTDGHLMSEMASSYLDALARLMVTENLPVWAPSLRSRTPLRAASVRNFVDPSLAVAAARATPERLLGDLRWLGFLFENLVVRDLRVYAQSLDGEVYAYRDETGLEADAVIEMPDGRWAAFEVKLGQCEVDTAAEHLLRLKSRIDSSAIGEPVALAVITATGYGYVRDEGVAVMPIGALAA